MWGRPQEHDREHHPGRSTDGSRHRGPTHENGNGAGGTADDNVLRRRTFEQQRVHEHVEGDRGHGQRGAEQVHDQAQPHEAGDAEHNGENQGLTRAHGVRGKRPRSRALHLLVDVAFQVLVERVGTAGREHPADERCADEPQGGKPVRGEHHRGNGRDQEEHDDPRLGEGSVSGDAFPDGRRRRGRLWVGGAALPRHDHEPDEHRPRDEGEGRVTDDGGRV
jgi:hypothetical protein